MLARKAECFSGTHPAIRVIEIPREDNEKTLTTVARLVSDTFDEGLMNVGPMKLYNHQNTFLQLKERRKWTNQHSMLVALNEVAFLLQTFTWLADFFASPVLLCPSSL
jgi:hypothetical protein